VTEEVPAAAAQGVTDNLAINVDKVLKAAPTLKVMPELVTYIAQHSDDIENDSQAVAGLHLMQTMAHAIHGHYQENRPQYDNLLSTITERHNSVGPV